MPTDVSSFKDVYKTAIESSFPEEATLVLGEQQIKLKAVATPLRYGTNPHQPFTAFAPQNSTALSVGNLDMLKGGKAGLVADQSAGHEPGPEYAEIFQASRLRGDEACQSLRF